MKGIVEVKQREREKRREKKKREKKFRSLCYHRE